MNAFSLEGNLAICSPYQNEGVHQIAAPDFSIIGNALYVGLPAEGKLYDCGSIENLISNNYIDNNVVNDLIYYDDVCVLVQSSNLEGFGKEIHELNDNIILVEGYDSITKLENGQLKSSVELSSVNYYNGKTYSSEYGKVFEYSITDLFNSGLEPVREYVQGDGSIYSINQVTNEGTMIFDENGGIGVFYSVMEPIGEMDDPDCINYSDVPVCPDLSSKMCYNPTTQTYEISGRVQLCSDQCSQSSVFALVTNTADLDCNNNVIYNDDISVDQMILFDNVVGAKLSNCNIEHSNGNLIGMKFDNSDNSILNNIVLHKKDGNSEGTGLVFSNSNNNVITNLTSYGYYEAIELINSNDNQLREVTLCCQKINGISHSTSGLNRIECTLCSLNSDVNDGFGTNRVEGYYGAGVCSTVYPAFDCNRDLLYNSCGDCIESNVTFEICEDDVGTGCNLLSDYETIDTDYLYYNSTGDGSVTSSLIADSYLLPDRVQDTIRINYSLNNPTLAELSYTPVCYYLNETCDSCTGAYTNCSGIALNDDLVTYSYGTPVPYPYGSVCPTRTGMYSASQISIPVGEVVTGTAIIDLPGLEYCEYIECYLRPSEQEEIIHPEECDSCTNSKAVTFSYNNTPPEISSLTLTELTPNNWECSAEFTDFESDDSTLNYNYTWTLAGEVITGATGSGTGSSFTNSQTIVPGPGEIIQCCVEVTDDLDSCCGETVSQCMNYPRSGANIHLNDYTDVDVYWNSTGDYACEFDMFTEYIGDEIIWITWHTIDEDGNADEILYVSALLPSDLDIGDNIDSTEISPNHYTFDIADRELCKCDQIVCNVSVGTGDPLEVKSISSIGINSGFPAGSLFNHDDDALHVNNYVPETTIDLNLESLGSGWIEYNCVISSSDADQGSAGRCDQDDPLNINRTWSYTGDISPVTGSCGYDETCNFTWGGEDYTVTCDIEVCDGPDDSDECTDCVYDSSTIEVNRDASCLSPGITADYDGTDYLAIPTPDDITSCPPILFGETPNEGCGYENSEYTCYIDNANLITEGLDSYHVYFEMYNEDGTLLFDGHDYSMGSDDYWSLTYSDCLDNDDCSEGSELHCEVTIIDELIGTEFGSGCETPEIKVHNYKPEITAPSLIINAGGIALTGAIGDYEIADLESYEMSYLCVPSDVWGNEDRTPDYNNHEWDSINYYWEWSPVDTGFVNTSSGCTYSEFANENCIIGESGDTECFRIDSIQSELCDLITDRSAECSDPDDIECWGPTSDDENHWIPMNPLIPNLSEYSAFGFVPDINLSNGVCDWVREGGTCNEYDLGMFCELDYPITVDTRADSINIYLTELGLLERECNLASAQCYMELENHEYCPYSISGDSTEPELYPSAGDGPDDYCPCSSEGCTDVEISGGYIPGDTAHLSFFGLGTLTEDMVEGFCSEGWAGVDATGSGVTDCYSSDDENYYLPWMATWYPRSHLLDISPYHSEFGSDCSNNYYGTVSNPTIPALSLHNSYFSDVKGILYADEKPHGLPLRCCIEMTDDAEETGTSDTVCSEPGCGVLIGCGDCTCLDISSGTIVDCEPEMSNDNDIEITCNNDNLCKGNDCAIYIEDTCSNGIYSLLNVPSCYAEDLSSSCYYNVTNGTSFLVEHTINLETMDIVTEPTTIVAPCYDCTQYWPMDGDLDYDVNEFHALGQYYLPVMFREMLWNSSYVPQTNGAGISELGLMLPEPDKISLADGGIIYEEVTTESGTSSPCGLSDTDCELPLHERWAGDYGGYQNDTLICSPTATHYVDESNIESVLDGLTSGIPSDAEPVGAFFATKYKWCHTWDEEYVTSIINYSNPSIADSFIEASNDWSSTISQISLGYLAYEYPWGGRLSQSYYLGGGTFERDNSIEFNDKSWVWNADEYQYNEFDCNENDNCNKHARVNCDYSLGLVYSTEDKNVLCDCIYPTEFPVVEVPDSCEDVSGSSGSWTVLFSESSCSYAARCDMSCPSGQRPTVTSSSCCKYTCEEYVIPDPSGEGSGIGGGTGTGGGYLSGLGDCDSCDEGYDESEGVYYYLMDYSSVPISLASGDGSSIPSDDVEVMAEISDLASCLDITSSQTSGSNCFDEVDMYDSFVTYSESNNELDLVYETDTRAVDISDSDVYSELIEDDYRIPYMFVESNEWGPFWDYENCEARTDNKLDYIMDDKYTEETEASCGFCHGLLINNTAPVILGINKESSSVSDGVYEITASVVWDDIDSHPADSAKVINYRFCNSVTDTDGDSVSDDCASGTELSDWISVTNPNVNLIIVPNVTENILTTNPDNVWVCAYGNDTDWQSKESNRICFNADAADETYYFNATFDDLGPCYTSFGDYDLEYNVSEMLDVTFEIDGIPAAFRLIEDDVWVTVEFNIEGGSSPTIWSGSYGDIYTFTCPHGETCSLDMSVELSSDVYGDHDGEPSYQDFNVANTCSMGGACIQDSPCSTDVECGGLPNECVLDVLSECNIEASGASGDLSTLSIYFVSEGASCVSTGFSDGSCVFDDITTSECTDYSNEVDDYGCTLEDVTYTASSSTCDCYDPWRIDTCGEISSPGHYYFGHDLTVNYSDPSLPVVTFDGLIVNSTTPHMLRTFNRYPAYILCCLEITSDNVTIDLNGTTLNTDDLGLSQIDMSSDPHTGWGYEFAGICSWNQNNITIENGSITHWDRGILMKNINGLNIDNIYLNGSGSITDTYSLAYGADDGKSTAISICNSENVLINEVNAELYYAGVQLMSSNNSIITNSRFEGNSRGIETMLWGSCERTSFYHDEFNYNLTVIDNTFVDCMEGLELAYTNNISVDDNIFNGSINSGVDVYDRLIDTQITNNQFINIGDSSLTSSPWGGIVFRYVTEMSGINTINDNEFTNSEAGLYFYKTGDLDNTTYSELVIERNNFSDNGYGVYKSSDFSMADLIRFKDNRLISNEYGIKLEHSGTGYYGNYSGGITFNDDYVCDNTIADVDDTVLYNSSTSSYVGVTCDVGNSLSAGNPCSSSCGTTPPNIITTCGVISSPGHYYFGHNLTVNYSDPLSPVVTFDGDNVTSTTPNMLRTRNRYPAEILCCLEITSDNVTIDLNGTTLNTDDLGFSQIDISSDSHTGRGYEFAGICSWGQSNITIENGSITHWDRGILMKNIDGLNIDTVYLNGTGSTTSIHSLAYGAGDGKSTAISICNSENVLINDVNTELYYAGVQLMSSDNSIITDSGFGSNSRGIETMNWPYCESLPYSEDEYNHDLIVIDNIFLDCMSGVMLAHTNNVSVDNNIFNGCRNSGINVYDRFIDTQITNNQFLNIGDSSLTSSPWGGIVFRYVNEMSGTNTINDNVFTNSEAGLYFYGGGDLDNTTYSELVIERNVFSGNEYGVYKSSGFSNADLIRFDGNRLTSNEYGIKLEHPCASHASVEWLDLNLTGWSGDMVRMNIIDPSGIVGSDSIYLPFNDSTSYNSTHTYFVPNSIIGCYTPSELTNITVLTRCGAIRDSTDSDYLSSYGARINISIDGVTTSQIEYSSTSTWFGPQERNVEINMPSSSGEYVLDGSVECYYDDAGTIKVINRAIDLQVVIVNNSCPASYFNILEVPVFEERGTLPYVIRGAMTDLFLTGRLEGVPVTDCVSPILTLESGGDYMSIPIHSGPYHDNITFNNDYVCDNTIDVDDSIEYLSTFSSIYSSVTCDLGSSLSAGNPCSIACDDDPTCNNCELSLDIVTPLAGDGEYEGCDGVFDSSVQFHCARNDLNFSIEQTEHDDLCRFDWGHTDLVNHLDGFEIMPGRDVPGSSDDFAYSEVPYLSSYDLCTPYVFNVTNTRDDCATDELTVVYVDCNPTLCVGCMGDCNTTSNCCDYDISSNDYSCIGVTSNSTGNCCVELGDRCSATGSDCCCDANASCSDGICQIVIDPEPENETLDDPDTVIGNITLRDLPDGCSNYMCNVTSDCCEGYCYLGECEYLPEALWMFGFWPKPGCAGLPVQPVGIFGFIICDLMWIWVLILSTLAAWTARKDDFKGTPVGAFIIPILVALLLFPYLGVIVAIAEYFMLTRRVSTQTYKKEIEGM